MTIPLEKPRTLPAMAELISAWPNAVEALYASSGEIDELVALLTAIRDARADLDSFYKRVEKDALEAMPAKKVVVDGVGEIEHKHATTRKAWDYEKLFPAAVARFADEPGVFFDPFDGSILPYATIGHNVARRIRDCFSISGGKVGGLRAIGIDPDEYAVVTPGESKLVLPKREL